MNTIADNCARVLERIAAAARRAGRRPGEVTLLASTKGRSLAEMDEAIRAGVTVVGENRVQEAEAKYPHLKGRVQLHMIGHLQRNKVKEALRIFDMVHSVDSLRLAEEIEKAAGRAGRVMPVLLEVNVSGEESKFGVGPAGVRPLLSRISQMRAVRVEGLMAMSPLTGDPEKSRPIFRRLRGLASEIEREAFPGVAMGRLSMGMTQDFEVAVEEGATIVRVGTAIFQQA